MQLGTAGEQFDSMKGVSLAMLRSPDFKPVSVDVRAAGGISQVPAVQVPAVQVPAVQLAAFGDGSVHPGQARRGDVNGDGNGISVFSRLEPVDPSDPSNVGWAGPITLVGGDGGSLTGILIGLLRPALAGGGLSLQGLVVAQDGTGDFAGAPGTGRASFHWDAGLEGGFGAQVSLKPFVHAGGVN